MEIIQKTGDFRRVHVLIVYMLDKLTDSVICVCLKIGRVANYEVFAAQINLLH